MATRLAPIPRDTLRDRVVLTIEEAILAGKLKAGERLIELDLAQQMGVSRGPVREGIRELIAQGLLVEVPRRGTYVASWSVKALAEVYSLRAWLEEKAARLAASSVTADDVAHLEQIAHDLGRAAQTGDTIECVRQDLAFHRTLVSMAGHELLLQAWSNLGLVRLILLARPSTEITGIVYRHQAVVKALREGDAERTGRLLRNHILWSVLREFRVPEAELRSQVTPALAEEILQAAEVEWAPGVDANT